MTAIQYSKYLEFSKLIKELNKELEILNKLEKTLLLFTVTKVWSLCSIEFNSIQIMSALICNREVLNNRKKELQKKFRIYERKYTVCTL